MCSRFLSVGLAVALAACHSGPPEAAGRVLRVCADPNNLPFSNVRLEGFENRIAEIVARALDARLEYTWWAQRRGFIRNTLGAGACDVVIGVPTRFELTATTRPYYRSTYVFVTRAGQPIPSSFDDPELRHAVIGVQLIGDDFSNSPPAHALAARGIVGNVRGYSVYGDYRAASPPARVVEAVGAGIIDLAVVWGPLAGDAARRSATPLVVTPVSPEIDRPSLPFVFEISMGVARRNAALLAELNAVIDAERPAIEHILDEFHVPRVDHAVEVR